MWARSNAPAPAHRIARVGASSATSASRPGVTVSGCSSLSTASGIRFSVMRVAAVGARQLTRMSFLAPSIESVCISPTSAIFAAP